MTLSPLRPVSDSPLYEQVAQRLQGLIDEGTLGPGDRLPSVRRLHHQLSVSVSTVLEAYRLLEDQGLITARPQSGYYVRSGSQLPPEPAPSEPPQQSYAVDLSLALQIISSVRDPDLLQLGAAIPSVEHLPTAALNRIMGKVLRSESDAVHSYDASSGRQLLQQEVAKRMLNAGCSTTPEAVVITNGATEAVYLSLRAVTQPGQVVAIESPIYFGMLEVLKSLELKALELPTHPRDGISLAALEEAIQSQQVSACLLIPNFNNPTGSCMSDEKKKALVDLLNRYDLPLVEDDIYGELQFEGDRPKAVKAFDTEGRVLYCTSVSKTLSPGLRVGWSIAGRYQPQIQQLKMVVSHASAIAPQLTVATFFANGGCDRHLRRLRRLNQSQTARMLQSIQSCFPADTRVTQPRGGHVLWLQMPPGFDSLALYRAALQHRISIAPGVMFSASGSYGHCFRLNTALPWSSELEQAIETIGQLAGQLLTGRVPSGGAG
ncbi:MAG: PLP-dependent aminotransferase family protein [Elainellaceae cyanobacterium]